MINKNVFLKASVVLFVLAFVVMAIPAISQAASYGYVSNSGNVMIYVSDSADSAIRNAPNISERSGVILLDSQGDNEMVGDRTLVV